MKGKEMAQLGTKMAKVWIGSDVDGHEEAAEQLATFTHYIKGYGFRFIVTKRGPDASVTHRLTGLRICAASAATSLGDWLVAGRTAVDALVKDKGADRVVEILNRAEKVGYGLLRGKDANAA